MGLFSWRTKDTNRPIYVKGNQAGMPLFDVWMHLPDGRKYLEPAYEGYGIFGGKDFFIALSECNPTDESVNFTDDDHRNRGIDLSFDITEKKGTVKFPVLTELDEYMGEFTKCEDLANQGYWPWGSDDGEEYPDNFVDTELLSGTVKREREEEEQEESAQKKVSVE